MVFYECGVLSFGRFSEVLDCLPITTADCMVDFLSGLKIKTRSLTICDRTHLDRNVVFSHPGKHGLLYEYEQEIHNFEIVHKRLEC